MNSLPVAKPIMILGTSSGSGKSLMTTAICRHLLKKGERPIPFKGQNMSNNAWVDQKGCEMAYSQAVQAWAADIEPTCEMNPILLKPKGDCTSEVIHLGRSVGIAHAKEYFENWFESGWEAIKIGLKTLSESYPMGRLILEGAGSPVEVNLQHRDLTNLKLASFLKADCILVADIERGGVFAQLIGTLSLLKPYERDLIKGIIINRFRGDISLFDNGRDWLEKKTNIPILGIMPWLNDIFPPEDSLDLLERKTKKNNPDLEIVVIKLPYLSNFSDLDPLEAEQTLELRWVSPGQELGEPDAVIIPGSKQTIKDLDLLKSSGLAGQIKSYASNGGNIIGICGGMQMLGSTLEDPLGIEQSKEIATKITVKGLNLLPLNTVFEKNKFLLRREAISRWPGYAKIYGFELHHGKSYQNKFENSSLESLFEDPLLGFLLNKKGSNHIVGTYLHGIFDNGIWRRHWINELRNQKGLKKLSVEVPNHHDQRECLIDRLEKTFSEHINMAPFCK